MRFNTISNISVVHELSRSPKESRIVMATDGWYKDRGDDDDDDDKAAAADDDLSLSYSSMTVVVFFFASENVCIDDVTLTNTYAALLIVAFGFFIHFSSSNVFIFSLGIFSVLEMLGVINVLQAL